jgi:peroxiredoxin (alkyl hydroperoxide reductase subunit C)
MNLNNGNGEIKMSVLVGKKAPNFIAPAVLRNGDTTDMLEFYKVKADKYAVLVFYPLDFTFVCPSELIALDRRVDLLRSLNVEVLSISIDSHFTHSAWRNTLINKGGIGQVKFTMVADIKHTICKDYGIEADDQGVAYRGTFLIDKDGIVRHQVVNDLPLGRNMDELIRMVEALHFFEKNGEVCPAGWKKGDSGMNPSPEGVASYLSENSTAL